MRPMTLSVDSFCWYLLLRSRSLLSQHMCLSLSLSPYSSCFCSHVSRDCWSPPIPLSLCLSFSLIRRQVFRSWFFISLGIQGLAMLIILTLRRRGGVTNFETEEIEGSGEHNSLLYVLSFYCADYSHLLFSSSCLQLLEMTRNRRP